jgi:hypothetical protein
VLSIDQNHASFLISHMSYLRIANISQRTITYDIQAKAADNKDAVKLLKNSLVSLKNKRKLKTRISTAKITPCLLINGSSCIRPRLGFVSF